MYFLFSRKITKVYGYFKFKNEAFARFDPDKWINQFMKYFH